MYQAVMSSCTRTGKQIDPHEGPAWLKCSFSRLKTKRETICHEKQVVIGYHALLWFYSLQKDGRRPGRLVLFEPFSLIKGSSYNPPLPSVPLVVSSGRRRSYLTVCVDGGAQQFPGPPPAVHAQHPQDLQEAQAAQGRGQHVTLVPHRHHRHRGNQHEDVWERTTHFFSFLCEVMKWNAVNKLTENIHKYIKHILTLIIPD